MTCVCIAWNHFRVVTSSRLRFHCEERQVQPESCRLVKSSDVDAQNRKSAPRFRSSLTRLHLSTSARAVFFFFLVFHLVGSVFFLSLSLSHATLILFDGSIIPVLSPTLGRSVVCVSVCGPECGSSLSDRRAASVGRSQALRRRFCKGAVKETPHNGTRPPALKPSAPPPPTRGSGTLILHSDKIIPQNLRRVCTSVLSATTRDEGEKKTRGGSDAADSADRL